jgi:type I restriction enzyme M protein
MRKKNTKTAPQEPEENGPVVVDADAAAGTDEEVEVDEGQVVDLITGEPVKLTPKEEIRQEEERKLLEEFSYPEQHKEDLIRINFSVKPQQGKARRLPLVVLRPATNGSSATPEDRVYILIDIEAEKTRADDPKNGSESLAELLRDTAGAEFAVWTNGTERIVYWKESGRIKIRTKLITDIPRFGKGPEDCSTLDKQALRPAGGLSLRQAFQRCHDHIYANRGGSNEAVFWEFLKVVFAKIQDERRLQQAAAAGRQEERLFRIANLEERNDEKKAEAVKERLEQLYAEVRKAYPELFGSQADEIDIAAPILSYVVAQLELYSFLESSVDVKGEAYEAIVGKNLQGTRGEFFTPRNAVKLGIRILDPRPGDKCIDPACGTGGFVVVIMNYISELLKREMIGAGKNPDGKDRAKYTLKLRIASQRIFGLDINPNLVKVARMNMVMNNDGQGGITHLNSLDKPEAWRFPSGKHSFYQADGSTADEAIEAFFGRELAEGTFDICATNPPFGTKIKIEGSILSQYELAHKWGYDKDRQLWSPTPALQSGVAPEILFIERCVRLLKPGSGKLCIVLPDGILGNPDDEYIRVWLLKQCEVLALVDMPVELFLPKVGIQTHLVFLRRKSTDEMNQESLSGAPASYPIFMAVAKKVGKDRRANRLYKRDRDGRVLEHFRRLNGADYYQISKKSTVVDFEPDVDEHGRMVDDDLPFIAKAYHEFLAKKANGQLTYDR